MTLAAGALVLVGTVLAPQSRAAVEPGFGKAQANLLMLDPRTAQLSFGVRFGPTVADHRNTVARAQAQSTDYGLIGGALTGEGCTGGDPTIKAEDLPQRMQADSRDPSGAEVKEVSEGPITQSVQALPRPYSKATSRLAEADLPGIVSLRGAKDSTVSGVLEDGTPTVEARVDVAEVSILGLVDLQGLHWQALHQAGKDPVGRFTIGEATIGGVPIPTQDATVVVEAINNLLSNLGLVMTPPRSHLEGDTMFVDPIKIGIAANQTRDLIAGTALSALQPVREQLFQALLDASCDSGALITVVDILLGSVTGGGSLTVAIGGAQAQRTDAVDLVHIGSDGGGSGGGAFGGSDGGAALPSGGGATDLGAGLGTGSSGSTAGTVTTSGRTAVDGRSAAATRETDDDRGPAVAVGLLALLLGAVLVEADRRKMRQAGVLAPIHAPTEARG